MNDRAAAREPDDVLEIDADAAIEACGDARAAVKTLLVALHEVEQRVAKIEKAVSAGFARGATRRSK